MEYCPPKYPKGTVTVSFNATSAQSTAVPAGIYRARLFPDARCLIEIGVNPTASASTIPLTALVAEEFDVRPGEKIAVIQVGTTGTLYITWLS